MLTRLESAAVLVSRNCVYQIYIDWCFVWVTLGYLSINGVADKLHSYSFKIQIYLWCFSDSRRRNSTGSSLRREENGYRKGRNFLWLLFL